MLVGEAPILYRYPRVDGRVREPPECLPWALPALISSIREMSNVFNKKTFYSSKKVTKQYLSYLFGNYASSGGGKVKYQNNIMGEN